MRDFTFKRFSVDHHRSTMKVGTDGVLLGAWTEIPSRKPSSADFKALEIGCGCGIISLMLAQRLHENAWAGHASVLAVDIHGDSCAEALSNVEQSPWKATVRVENIDFLQYPDTEPFDLLVSNPPFFADSLKSPAPARNLARHNDTLPFDSLLRQSERLLKYGGRLVLVIPPDTFEQIEEIRAQSAPNLSLRRLTRVYSKPGKACGRLLCEWLKTASAQGEPLREDTLFICDAQGAYTPEYRRLVKDFYLWA